ncbi:Ig domain-containing protein [Kutzneria sp. CA-103260]|uniref:Ig domain-containing protein n=1 Tax=Kutzneria sp. CA-103260 TaxID=2802641 RepID=UPI001BAC2875|nr:Ig domain-containing protein [Kutzneria sp. CA-103260]QUQ64196.1 Putative Ig domain protein [Kutzneria sp. CA-103260]
MICLAAVAAGTAGSLVVFSAGQQAAGIAEPEPVITGGGPSTTPRTTALTIAEPNDQHGSVGTPVHLHIALSGAFGAQTFHTTGLPTGLTIDTFTGDISGTPTTAGTTRVTVTATDAGGNSGETGFNWTIAPVTISLTTPDDQHTSVGDAVSLALNAHASDQGPLTYQASPLPTGLSIAPSTGRISGSPAAPGTWTVTITIIRATAAAATVSFHWTVSPPVVRGSAPPEGPDTTSPAPPPGSADPQPGTGNQPGCADDTYPWDWDC